MAFSLGSLVGGAAQGYDQAAQLALKQLAAQQQNAGQGTAGQILSDINGGPQGQPAPQQGGGLGGILSELKSKYLSPQAQPPAAMPNGGRPQAAPQGQPQQQPAQNPIGQMTLEQIVQSARRINPNMRPEELMAATERLLPYMNAQALSQYRQVQQQLAARNASDREQFHGDLEADKARHEAGVQDRFTARQEAVSDRFKTSTELAREKIANAKDESTRKALTADYNKALDNVAKLEKNKLNTLSSATMSPDDKKAMIAHIDEELQSAKDALGTATDNKSVADSKRDNPLQGESAAAGNGKTNNPNAHNVGDVITVGGKQYRYKGGDWDARESFEEVNGR